MKLLDGFIRTSYYKTGKMSFMYVMMVNKGCYFYLLFSLRRKQWGTKEAYVYKWEI